MCYSLFLWVCFLLYLLVKPLIFSAPNNHISTLYDTYNDAHIHTHTTHTHTHTHTHAHTRIHARTCMYACMYA